MKKILLILFYLLICSNAFCAVAHVESFWSTSSPYSSAAQTYELTLSSATNGILIVTSQGSAGSLVTASTITWNGDSLTNLSTATDVWYLLSPDSGTHDLVVTPSGAVYDLYTSTSLYSGIDQSAPSIEARDSGTTPSPDVYDTEVSDSVTTSENNSMIYAVGMNNSFKKYNSNGYTVRVPDGLANNTGTTNRFLVMDLIKTPAGSSTFEYIVSNPGFFWEINMVVLEPVSTLTVTPNVGIF